jgi:phosphoribosylanthranilate isomerase
MFVKVCGLKTVEQIDKAIELGFDAIGVVCYPKSKRFCADEDAIRLANYAKGKIKSFVVSIKFDEVKNVTEHFDYIQIYEVKDIENLAYSSKDNPKDIKCEYFVYDASTGSGAFKAFPGWLKGIKQPLLLAGGLNKDNVSDVIKEIQPFGVDVSSGVEVNGVKDFTLMKEFIEIVRSCY